MNAEEARALAENNNIEELGLINKANNAIREAALANRKHAYTFLDEALPRETVNQLVNHLRGQGFRVKAHFDRSTEDWDGGWEVEISWETEAEYVQRTTPPKLGFWAKLLSNL